MTPTKVSASARELRTPKYRQRIVADKRKRASRLACRKGRR